MRKETPHTGVTLQIVAGAVFLLVGLRQYRSADHEQAPLPGDPPMGKVGTEIAFLLQNAIGKPGAYLLVLSLGVWGVILYSRPGASDPSLRAFGTLVLVAALSTSDALLEWTWAFDPAAPGWPSQWGGTVGQFFAMHLHDAFGPMGTAILLGTVLIASATLATDAFFFPLASSLLRGAHLRERVGSLRARLMAPRAGEKGTEAPPHATPRPAAPRMMPLPLPAEEFGADVIFKEPPRSASAPRKAAAPAAGTYQLPPSTLLERAGGGQENAQDRFIREQAATLEETLAVFGIQAKVVGVEPGPVITQYELSLGSGVKVHKIVAMEEDLQLALKASTLRIEAPIPGRSTVGIQVPNEHRAMVRISELMGMVDLTRMRLPLFLGKDAKGAALVSDLAEMPHLLVAGSTNSGKTVCLNSIVLSLLLTQPPDRVKLILIDPKMVEMSDYAGVPHLLAPVVTDMRRAADALEWAVRQMDDRYSLLQRTNVRSIETYNKLGLEEVRSRLGEPEAQVPADIPYIVIVVDEMADLMLQGQGDCEALIQRLAQKARGAGVHVILATQRPSVDVITGVIRANLPCRVAFQVPTKVDSRVILDRNGAEKLLGAGDMLFLPPKSAELIRAQGCYVSSEEIRQVVDFVKEQGEPVFDEELARWKEGGVGEEGESDDPFYDQAVRFTLETQRGSASLLQRQFKLGYTRASRLIDQMQRNGIVGAYKGSQAREVLVTLEEWDKRDAQGTG